MKPTLIIMAAGLGSRFGGLKQLTPVGAGGALLMDYAVFDAVRAGFQKVVFVIKEEMKPDFEALVLSRLAGQIEAVCAFQRPDDLPPGFSVPAGRVKPWGTGQAVWAARGEVTGPFCAINADDFYGRDAFAAVGAFLQSAGDTPPYRCCMAGYPVENTLSKQGSVSRGVCAVDADGQLRSIDERLKLSPDGGGAVDLTDGTRFPAGTPVSLNLWGFAGGVMGEIETAFAQFLSQLDNPIRDEFYLPAFVDTLIQAGVASVSVLPVQSKWYGMTYQEDRPVLTAALDALTAQGEYPAQLWA